VGEVGVRMGASPGGAARGWAFHGMRVARGLLLFAAVVWLAMALTIPFAVRHPRDEHTFATLLIGGGLGVAVWLALRRPGLVGILSGILGTVMVVALAYPDDDTRHLRQFVLAGAYIQHEPGRERYAFQPVGDWPWSTFVLAAAVAATILAACILLVEWLRRTRTAPPLTRLRAARR
jgi:hypothetical protein